MATRSLVRSGLVNFAETRSMLVGNNFYIPTSFDLLETRALESDTSSVSFTSLETYAADYKHLQIRTSTRGTTAAASVSVDLVINNDTGANYSFSLIEGNGTSGSPYRESGSILFLAPTAAASSASNIFGSTVTDILDAFSVSKNKTIKTIGGWSGSVQMVTGHRRSLEAISSIEIKSRTGNFVAGSRFSIYGVKG
jgi:hypothetical protein